MNPAIVIPAIKKNVAFPDDLVKKLAGIPLIQRVIDNVVENYDKNQVILVTDSEEIKLIAHRNDINCIYDQAIKLEPHTDIYSLYPYLQPLIKDWDDVIILSPYVPLLKSTVLTEAYNYYQKTDAEVLIPVFDHKIREYLPAERSLGVLFHKGNDQYIVSESHIFTIIKSELLEKDLAHKVTPVAHHYDKHPLEIKNYEDWWICEKLINRKRIVFRIIGHNEVGMGHIFRCLALAHEITDHEIRFVCDRKSEIAANKLAGYDYWLGVYEEDEIEQAIIKLEPDIVINDVLNTTAEYIENLKSERIIVINLEDLGAGSKIADLTINDLYHDFSFSSSNILWGYKWFFIRDEFNNAKRHKTPKQIQRILLAFGGTDPSDLTRKVLRVIHEYCMQKDIAIDIVTGDGYEYIDELERLIKTIHAPEITYTHATGVISHIMEKTELAICSNGRTVYELAHMKIPAIVISHHERELTHGFSCFEHGFISLGLYNGSVTDELILTSFKKLVEDKLYIQKIYSNIPKINFIKNKQKVVNKILSLLPEAAN